MTTVMTTMNFREAHHPSMATYSTRILGRLGHTERLPIQEGCRSRRAEFLGLVAVGDEARDQMDDEMGGVAMARMLNLRDVLELIEDRLNERAFAQQPRLLVGVLWRRPHVLAFTGQEVDTKVLPDLARQRLGQVAFVTDQRTDQRLNLGQQVRDRRAIIHIAR